MQDRIAHGLPATPLIIIRKTFYSFAKGRAVYEVEGVLGNNHPHFTVLERLQERFIPKTEVERLPQFASEWFPQEKGVSR